jgi:uncharacterized membrane protein
MGVLLACFDGSSAAGKARRPIDAELRAAGAVVLDTTVLKVNAKHKAAVHDPRRVPIGALAAAFTWGVFGLVANGWLGLVIWAVVGAICGGLFAYYSLHHESKAEFIRIGTRLPANSSALLIFAEATDPSALLTATAGQEPAVASVAAIAGDLSVRVFAGAEFPVEVAHDASASTLPTDHSGLLSMIMLRYSDADTAKRTAKALQGSKAPGRPRIELVIETDAKGGRHVTDPKYGPAAWAKSDLVSWGLFGVVVGAISGATGGGILKGGVVTGIAWAIFGVFAGAIYGLVAGRAISARRLKGIGRLLPAGSSMLLAWADGAVSRQTIDTLAAPESQWIVLCFDPTEGGALLAAA